MSPNRHFLSTTAFPHHCSGEFARLVLCQIEIATRKASSVPPLLGPQALRPSLFPQLTIA